MKPSDQQLFDKIIEAGRKKNVSRRDFMHYSIMAGMTTAAAGSLWTTQVSAQTPQKGGTFRVGLNDGNTSDSHDPGKYASVMEIMMGHTYRSYMTMITTENTLGPDLADSWEANEDATEWTFNLNKNATFHDGRPVTAKDVKASFDFHMNPESASAASSLLGDIEEVVIADDHTVVFKAKRGFADLPWIMTDYHFVICPAKEGGGIEWESGIGSGPYKLTNWEPGVRADLERHDGWHGEGAYFDKIEYQVINDNNARQSALETGSVDAVSLIDLQTKAFLERNPEIVIEDIESGQAITMPMHCDVAPFDNVDVRLALKYAIDREEIIKKIMFGAGTLGNDFHISPNMPYYPEGIPQRVYDPDKAKFHLKKAGMENLNVSISTTDSIFSGAVNTGELYAASAKKAGINLKVVREPNDGYWSNVWLKKPFCMVRWGARATPDQMFTTTYKDDADWNESHWQNKRFNELLLMAKSELNDELRAEMYREMALLMRDDGGTVLPVFSNFVYARNKNVSRGENVAGSWELDGGRAVHRWWFNK